MTEKEMSSMKDTPIINAEAIKDAIEEQLGRMFDGYVFSDFVEENVPEKDLKMFAEHCRNADDKYGFEFEDEAP